MTAQANAYFANKLKERELNEVSIPTVGLKSKQLYEVDIPKVDLSRAELREKERANKANEEIKNREIQEQQRYHDLTHTVDLANVQIKKDTTLTRGEQARLELGKALAGIYSKGGIDNGWGAIPAGLYQENLWAVAEVLGPENDVYNWSSDVGKSNSNYIKNPDNTKDPTALVAAEYDPINNTQWYRVPDTKKKKWESVGQQGAKGITIK